MDKVISETNWKKWFAWYPVTTISNKTIWLRIVMRRIITVRGVSSTYVYIGGNPEYTIYRNEYMFPVIKSEV